MKYTFITAQTIVIAVIQYLFVYERKASVSAKSSRLKFYDYVFREFIWWNDFQPWKFPANNFTFHEGIIIRVRLRILKNDYKTYYIFNYSGTFCLAVLKFAGCSPFSIERQFKYLIYWAARVTVVRESRVNGYHICGLRSRVTSAHARFLSSPRRKREWPSSPAWPSKRNDASAIKAAAPSPRNTTFQEHLRLIVSPRARHRRWPFFLLFFFRERSTASNVLPTHASS